jgi:hypothetical protein
MLQPQSPSLGFLPAARDGAGLFAGHGEQEARGGAGEAEAIENQAGGMVGGGIVLMDLRGEADVAMDKVKAHARSGFGTSHPCAAGAARWRD